MRGPWESLGRLKLWGSEGRLPVGKTGRLSPVPAVCTALRPAFDGRFQDRTLLQHHIVLTHNATLQGKVAAQAIESQNPYPHRYPLQGLAVSDKTQPTQVQTAVTSQGKSSAGECKFSMVWILNTPA